METEGIRRPLDDLEPQPFRCRRAGGDLALVATVGEQEAQSGKAAANAPADHHEAIAILDVGRMDRERQRQAQGVGDQMTLAAQHLLAGVESARPAGFGGLDALAVDDAGRGRGLLAGLFPGRHQERRLDARPDALLPEAAKAAVDGSGRWKVLGQYRPRAAGTEKVEDRVQYLAQIGGARPNAHTGDKRKRSTSVLAPSFLAEPYSHNPLIPLNNFSNGL